MQPDLEEKIRPSSANLLSAIQLEYPRAMRREILADHMRLLNQRTPQDHAEMARRMGLPE